MAEFALKYRCKFPILREQKAVFINKYNLNAFTGERERAEFRCLSEWRKLEKSLIWKGP